MRRRDFIAVIYGATLALPSAALAQQPGKVWRIGHVLPTTPEWGEGGRQALEQRLADLGYVQGRNIVLLHRFTGGPQLDKINEVIISLGRVEDGRGGWGPMAITPFPISAHRTGGPDFRSPALRLASPQGTRRGSEWQAFEAQQTEFPIDSVVREPAGAAPCHFVPSCEKVAHALVGIAVNTAEC